MKTARIHNFNAGPAALPQTVLEEISESFLNFAGSGMSITEISHRSKQFDDVINDAVARTKRLLISRGSPGRKPWVKVIHSTLPKAPSWATQCLNLIWCRPKGLDRDDAFDTHGSRHGLVKTNQASPRN